MASGAGNSHGKSKADPAGENLDTKKNPDGYLGASVAALQSYAGTVDGAKTWAEISAKNFFLAGNRYRPKSFNRRPSPGRLFFYSKAFVDLQHEEADQNIGGLHPGSPCR
jgi:hypothetical protein